MLRANKQREQSADHSAFFSAWQIKMPDGRALKKINPVRRVFRDTLYRIVVSIKDRYQALLSSDTRVDAYPLHKGRGLSEGIRRVSSRTWSGL